MLRRGIAEQRRHHAWDTHRRASWIALRRSRGANRLPLDRADLAREPPRRAAFAERSFASVARSKAFIEAFHSDCASATQPVSVPDTAWLRARLLR